MSADLPALQSIFKRASLSNAADHAALLHRPEVLVFAWSDDPTFLCRMAPADAEGNLVGFATIRADHVIELGDLFVDPDHVHQGIVRWLLDDVVVPRQSTGARRLETGGNPHAQAFYESIGCVVESMMVTPVGPGLRFGRSLEIMVANCSPNGRRATRGCDATRR